jgi:hypothetical protein
MIIKGFYHIWLYQHWYSIVSDQIRILLTSGLYDACEEINVNLIGSKEEQALFEKYFSDIYPKLIIRTTSIEPTDYEFNALRMIENDYSQYAGFYFHAKGVSKPFDTKVNHWRAMLNQKILCEWGQHYQNILTGYDVSSVNYLRRPDHFSGNFYWFNREYIYQLPQVDALDHNNRWMAEQYICLAKGNFIYPAFQEPGETAFKIKYER